MSRKSDTVSTPPDRLIEISREYDAPRELVWDAWTDPKQVVKWWGPDGFSTTIEEMDVRPGGVWKHTFRGPDGAKYPNKSVFTEVVKPEKIVYQHAGAREGGPGVHFTSTWTFESLGPKKMRLTIRMVFDKPEDKETVVREYGAVEGGKQTLARLDDHLSTTATAPFIISRTFNAPKDLVWKAWTERDRLMQWFGPMGFKMTQATLDFRPGGTFHYCIKGPDGKEMWGKFTYRVIVPQEKMVLVNSFSDAAGGVTRHPFSPDWPRELLTTSTFEEKDGKTTVTIEWSPLHATEVEVKTFADARPGMTGGWTGTFEQLEAYLAKG
jgi:uncharacterized protein YndB with AHSA1/START domain